MWQRALRGRERRAHVRHSSWAEEVLAANIVFEPLVGELFQRVRDARRAVEHF